MVRDQLRRVARWLHARWRPIALGVALYVVAASAFRLARRDAGYWGIDDAAITYSAAFELADHHSLAPALEGTPVESYSNPLLFFVVAFLRVFGLFDPVTTHVSLEMCVFAIMPVLVWSLARSLFGELAAVLGALVFTGLELVTPATWIWYGSGLENVWLAAGVVALAWLCARTARGVPLDSRWGTLAFAVAITRPEAPVYVAAFYLALVLAPPAQLAPRAHLRQVVRALVVTAALYAVFLCWRRFAYGDWLPNTYYAKMPPKTGIDENLRKYVVPNLLTETQIGLFAATGLALLYVPALARIAPALLVMTGVSLALPIRVGADWMGDHRFGTTFIAAAHATFAVFVAAAVAELAKTRAKSWRFRTLAPLLGALVLIGMVHYDRLAYFDKIGLTNVSVSRFAEKQGGARWEHQMRLGLPNAVVLTPDAGGFLLVGGAQLVDNGLLTDFQMARLGPNLTNERTRFTNPVDLRVLNRYQHDERRPDLVDDNQSWPLDHHYIGTTYLAGEGRFFARDDLVKLAPADAAAVPPWFSQDGLTIAISPETIPIAAPGALVRCEVLVTWTKPLDGKTHLRAWIDGGDHDEIALKPYGGFRQGAERRALLVGAPARDGAVDVMIEVTRDGKSLARTRAISLEVTRDSDAIARAAEALAGGAPLQVARRVAWLREQQVVRMPMTRFQHTMDSLDKSEKQHDAIGGSDVLALRWNARLADLEPLPAAIRGAEAYAIHAVVAACPAGAPVARRTYCLGRAVDGLRRLGYLDVVARARLRDPLAAARAARSSLSDADRYLVLVGLYLADPSDVALQRELLDVRHALAARNALPAL